MTTRFIHAAPRAKVLSRPVFRKGRCRRRPRLTARSSSRAGVGVLRPFGIALGRRTAATAIHGPAVRRGGTGARRCGGPIPGGRGRPRRGRIEAEGGEAAGSRELRKSGGSGERKRQNPTQRFHASTPDPKDPPATGADGPCAAAMSIAIAGRLAAARRGGQVFDIHRVRAQHVHDRLAPSRAAKRLPCVPTRKDSRDVLQWLGGHLGSTFSPRRESHRPSPPLTEGLVGDPPLRCDMRHSPEWEGPHAVRPRCRDVA